MNLVREAIDEDEMHSTNAELNLVDLSSTESA